MYNYIIIIIINIILLVVRVKTRTNNFEKQDILIIEYPYDCFAVTMYRYVSHITN